MRQANVWLEEHGSIGGGNPAKGSPISTRSTARYHAQRMKRLLVQMGHRDLWELRERVWQEAGESGFRWSVMFERGDEAHD